MEWAEGNDAAEARFYIGEAYRNRGDYSQAILAYYKVSYHGADASTNWIVSADLKRSECNVEFGEVATARSIYEKIIRAVGANSAFGRFARERIDAL